MRRTILQVTSCLILLALFILTGCDLKDPASRPSAKSIVARESRAIEIIEAVTSPTASAKPGNRSYQSDESPVKMILRSSHETVQSGDSLELTVHLDIPPTFEIHSLDAPPPSIATQLVLDLPPGFRPVGEWTGPSSMRSARPEGSQVYIGRATFTRRIHVDENAEGGDQLLTCSVRYQACNATRCLRPVEVYLGCDIDVRK